MVADEDTDGKATAWASHRELPCVTERPRSACWSLRLGTRSGRVNGDGPLMKSGGRHGRALQASLHDGDDVGDGGGPLRVCRAAVEFPVERDRGVDQGQVGE